MTGILAGVATVLMALSFPVPFMPPFIKLDFSELPALIASFALGPWYGVIVCLVKNLINMTMTTTMCVGELCNFLLGTAFVLPAGYIYRYAKNRKTALLGSGVGALCMAIIGLPLNYFVTYPFYSKVLGLSMDTILSMYQAILPSMQNIWQCLLLFNMPFTILKGGLVVLITFLIYKYVSPLLKGSQNGNKKGQP